MRIEVNNFSKTFRNVSVLENISVNLESGAIYVIIGPNGSGKSMFLRAISGLIYPTSGSISIDGAVLHKDISFPKNIGIIIEKPSFLGYLTGLDNLKMLADIKGILSTEQIAEYMTMFSLDPHDKKHVSKYSLGMVQKLGIIQAIMENPDVLILDEPFNALDEHTVSMLHDMLIQYKNDGKLIVITSHHKSDIENLCDYTYRIENGRIASCD